MAPDQRLRKILRRSGLAAFKSLQPGAVFFVVGYGGEMILVSEYDIASGEAISDESFRRNEYEFWSDAFAALDRHRFR